MSIGAIFPGGSNSAGSSSTEAYREKLLDLNTSNKEIIDIVDKVFKGEDASAADQNVVTALLGMRTQLATAVSNAIRTFIDGIAAVVRNLRA